MDDGIANEQSKWDTPEKRRAKAIPDTPTARGDIWASTAKVSDDSATAESEDGYDEFTNLEGAGADELQFEFISDSELSVTLRHLRSDSVENRNMVWQISQTDDWHLATTTSNESDESGTFEPEDHPSSLSLRVWFDPERTFGTVMVMRTSQESGNTRSDLGLLVKKG